MDKILHFDIAGGAAGDMLLASIADLSNSYQDKLESVLNLLTENLGNVHTKIEDVIKQGVHAKYVEVSLRSKHHEHEHHEHHNHEHHEHHNHEHHGHHNHEHHEHRNLESITKLINDCSISQKAKDDAINVFQIIGKAEALAHRIDINSVHFHEVGAYDSIIDIVAFCVMMDFIKPEKITSSPFPMGSGTIKCEHGIMPNPAPATVEITRGFPVYQTSIKGELITPTAAALLTYFASSFDETFKGTLIASGVGAGKKNYDGSSGVCRVMMLSASSNIANTQVENHYILECNIDDMTGETLGFVLERAIQLGASDAWFTPIVMKKSRPSYMFQILVDSKNRNALIEFVLNETSTLGLRAVPIEKIMLDREEIVRNTPYGDVRFKKRTTPNGEIHYKVEYDCASKIAVSINKDLNSVSRDLLKYLQLD